MKYINRLNEQGYIQFILWFVLLLLVSLQFYNRANSWSGILLLLIIIFLIYQNYYMNQKLHQKKQAREDEISQYYEAIFRQNTAPKLLIEPESGKILDANPAAIQFYGHTLEEILQMYIFDINTLNKAQIQAEMQKAKNSNRKYFEFRHRLSDGRIRDVKVYSGPIQHLGKTLLYSIVLDATEEKQYLHQLQEERQQLQDIIWGTAAGTWHWNLQTDELIINQRFAQQLGYQLSEMNSLTGKFLPTITHPDDWQQCLRNLHQHIDGQLNYYDIELRVRHREGHWLWVHDRARLISKKDKTNPDWISGTRMNITGRKKMELSLQQSMQQAQDANEAKTIFLANMSHELRTPLNAILGFSRLLIESKLDKTSQAQAQKIHSGGEYLLTIVNDILDISKVEAGKIELLARDVDTVEFFSGVENMFRYRAEQKELQFQYQTDDSLPRTIYIDPNRLRQILYNLLSNAIKFTEKGYVVLQTNYKNGELKILVEDTGIGVSLEKVTEIFEPFVQTGVSRYKSQGTGLGLAITKKIVELMDGEIGIHSELGQGSQFWVNIPLRKELAPKQITNHTNSNKQKNHEPLLEEQTVEYSESWLAELEQALIFGERKKIYQLLEDGQTEIPQKVQDWIAEYQYPYVLDWLEKLR